MQDSGRWHRWARGAALLLVLTACGEGVTTAIPGDADDTPSAAAATPATDAPAASTSSSPAATTTTAPPTTNPTTTTPTTNPTTSTTTTTTTSTTTSTTTTTTAPTTTTSTTPTTTTTSVAPAPALEMPAANAAFDQLAANNAAASMTVLRDGVPVLTRSSGNTIAGDAATSDTPMVVASVSKIVTAYAVARLAQNGDIDINGPVPWDIIGLTPHPAWNDVTVRELLDHTSGMPVVRTAWFTGVGDCGAFLPTLVDSPPQGHRGGWRYSNGNYCALGRLVEAVTGGPLDAAAQRLVFDPAGVDGAHLTTGGLMPDDVGHHNDVGRLSRLGGAGTFVVSTDDLAAMLAATTAEDYATLAWPGVITDQYGWGHTGTIDGAKACVWVLEFGRTVAAATVAGGWPNTGGGVCDRMVPGVAVDLGIGDGQPPSRTPP